MIKIIALNLFCIFSLLFLLSSGLSVERSSETPVIVSGASKLTGRIISPNDSNKNNIVVNITVAHPVSGEHVQYKAVVDQSGKFSIDLDVETTVSLIGLYTSLNREKSFLINLTSGGVTNIDIIYNSDYEIKNIDVTPAMNQNDMTLGLAVMNKMMGYRPDRAPQALYNKSTDYFLNHAKTVVSERLEILNNDTSISKGLKGILHKDFRLFMYLAHVFPYEEEMMRNHQNTSDDKNKSPDIHKIGKSYFGFLKDFNLNDPQYLNCFTFLEVQKEILQNEVLGLPKIGESSIPSWLTSVKVILEDLVGCNDGPYFDILAANAYGRQLNEEVKPLTERQKENIAYYWGTGEIAKILFRKNQQVIELDKLKSSAVVNDISSVPDDKVMEKIVAKHKGKVVFIDLWATWCAPCLEAIKQFRTSKNEFRDKDVVFVYLTNGSSPRKLWEEKITGIGNEHYYLTASQWEYVMNQFQFEYIPSYLLYNKTGVLSKKFSAFPGNEEVNGMINGLL